MLSVRLPWSLLVVLALCLPSTGCVLWALEAGGRHGNGVHSARARSGSAPTYDCSRNLFAGSTCIPRAVAPPLSRPVLAAAGAQETRLRPDGKLQARTNFTGGQLIVWGQPDKHPTRALFVLHSTRRLSPAPCEVRLFRDGSPLQVHESERRSAFEVLLTIEVADLRQLQDSVRFAGEACGRSFELDEAGRETLSQFEARFREAGSRRAAVLAAQPKVATTR